METSAMAMMNASLDNNLNVGTFSNATNAVYQGSAWGYWSDWYYPQVIRESYPVYVQERARDKGKQAFEIIKILKDKKLVQLSKVGDFIDLMDELIKIL
jgi:hypothetical protein